MKPLSVPREQVFPTTIGEQAKLALRQKRFYNMIVNASGTAWVTVPKGYTRVEGCSSHTFRAEMPLKARIV